MRTTIAINDLLLAEARARARERGLTLGQLVEEALRVELAADKRAPRGPVVPVFSGGTGPRPGLDLTSNRAVQAVLDEDGDIEQLR